MIGPSTDDNPKAIPNIEVKQGVCEEGRVEV
jgi:hypothetical protein